MDGVREGQEPVVDTKPIPCPTISPRMGSAALKSQDFIPSAWSPQIGWRTLAALFSFLVLHTSTWLASLPVRHMPQAGRRRRDEPHLPLLIHTVGKNLTKNVES